MAHKRFEKCYGKQRQNGAVEELLHIAQFKTVLWKVERISRAFESK